MSDQSDALVSCKKSLKSLHNTSEKIILCTQGDMLGFSRLADLQADQVKHVRKVEGLMQDIGEESYVDREVRDLITSVENLQIRIDHNLKVHAHMMQEEIIQLRAAKKQLNSLNSTYVINVKPPKNNLDTQS
jgi:hypothetical protein